MPGDQNDETADTLATVAPASTLSSSEAPAAPESGGRASPSRYRLGPVLARGGMGEVVSARDEQIGRAVAIKRMRAEHTSAEAVARFVREARIQGRLDHPAIVPVHELWHDEHGQPLFAMKQLAGVTLADVLVKLAAGEPAALKAYSRQRLLRAFAEVCLAIEFAHTRGVIHRDLKPANIMLGDFGEVYVLDWGVARVVEDTSRASFADIETLNAEGTIAGALLGTPGYMAPEQVRGDADLDGRIDVYALGCILYEILTLAPLHPRGLEALTATLGGAPKRPSLAAPGRDVPPELDAICLTAVMLDRAERFATARELGEAVQRFLDGDRDLAMRRELAAAELAAAREALAIGNATRQRGAAIRAAARALALDPTNREPADLVGRLMIEPPEEVPSEVEDKLAALDLDALEGARPLITLAGATFFAFVPILWWSGLRGAWYLASGSAIAAAIMLLGARTPRAKLVWGNRAIMVGWVLIVALFAVFSTPLLLAPGIAVMVAASIATHPMIMSRGTLVIAMVAAVLGPWLLSALGILRSTVSIAGDTVALHLATSALDPTAAKVGLVLYVVMIMTMSVLLAGQLARARRDAQRAVQIQAWQLRQLVPRAQTASLR